MLTTEKLSAEFCVIGGGMAGLCAALAAARNGVDTILMHERPMLGGNASSECRVHICGANQHGGRENARETGIVEELELRNLAINSQRSYSVWDTVLHEAAMEEPNLRLLLNCSCNAAQVEGGRIVSAAGWQITTQKRFEVRAQFYADCSGDGITAAVAGAEYRHGREGQNEFGESLAPEEPDDKTMGMTCLFSGRETDEPQPFTPPEWAYTFESPDDLPHRPPGNLECGYWWIELGGEGDSIADTEEVRDELLKIVYGIWDHLKNHGDYGAENWVLDWVQFLPGKRESRRLVGDRLLCQGDIESGGRFPDTVAYGGWSMDRHPPGGFWDPGPPARFGQVPDVYGIPLRSLYSRNIGNLWFAGRCASCTHVGMSSTRVMGTCAVMGQAVGTAVAYATQHDLSPRECASGDAIRSIQQRLLADDCFLPEVLREFGSDTAEAELTASSGEPEPLRDGVNRNRHDEVHCWSAAPGEWAEYRWSRPREVRSVIVAFDSNLTPDISLSYHNRRNRYERTPDEMVKEFEIQAEIGGEWKTIHRSEDNRQRFHRIAFDDLQATAIRLIPQSTHGSEDVRIFTLAINELDPGEFP